MALFTTTSTTCSRVPTPLTPAADDRSSWKAAPPGVRHVPMHAALVTLRNNDLGIVLPANARSCRCERVVQCPRIRWAPLRTAVQPVCGWSVGVRAAMSFGRGVRRAARPCRFVGRVVVRSRSSSVILSFVTAMSSLSSRRTAVTYVLRNGQAMQHLQRLDALLAQPQRIEGPPWRRDPRMAGTSASVRPLLRSSAIHRDVPGRAGEPPRDTGSHRPSGVGQRKSGSLHTSAGLSDGG